VFIFHEALALLMHFVVVMQNKEDSEKDEKRDEDRQKSKRGRPPLKSTLSSNMPYSLSKTANSEGKSGTRSAS
jgi:AT-rich interactive domain-containing protein 4A